MLKVVRKISDQAVSLLGSLIFYKGMETMENQNVEKYHYTQTVSTKVENSVD